MYYKYVYRDLDSVSAVGEAAPTDYEEEWFAPTYIKEIQPCNLNFYIKVYWNASKLLHSQFWNSDEAPEFFKWFNDNEFYKWFHDNLEWKFLL